MPPDPNITQETPTQDSTPTSPSEHAETSPESPEAPGNDFTPESTNSAINKEDAGTANSESEPKAPEIPENQASSTPEPQTAQIPVIEPLPEQPEPIQTQPKVSLARQFLILARNAIQSRKRKKLDKVMSLFLQQSKVTNDEVEKILHVSDATATRYLSILEKEGKIKQNSKTGTGVSYSRI